MARAALSIVLLALAGCATAPYRPSGELSSYAGLSAQEDKLRTTLAQRRNALSPEAVRRVALAPSRIVAGDDTAWLSAEERERLTREMDAQLCFELTERFDLVDDPRQADATVRAFVTRVKPTGRFGSTLAAGAGFFIPGPIGVRAPGSLGGLSAEAEMLDPSGRQLAALVWSRNANTVGTDDPSLSRIGDALQFVEPFADTAAKTLAPKGMETRSIADDDPCARYGPRFRPEGWLAKFATGLYVPQLSAAKDKGSAVTGEAKEAVAR